jgi:hypothetical protein
MRTVFVLFANPPSNTFVTAELGTVWTETRVAQLFHADETTKHVDNTLKDVIYDTLW